MPKSHFGGIHPRRRTNALALTLAGAFLFFAFSSLAAVLLLNPIKQDAHATKAPVVVEREDSMKMVSVLVPIQEIPAGTALEPRLFRKESRPQVGVSDLAIEDFEQIKSHYAKALIVGGIPLHREQVTSARPTNDMTANIPPGFRAVTINVDARTSVEGFVRPGASVDVEWATQISGRPGIVTIVENAQVLSAERQTQNHPAGGAVPSTVSLLVTAQDAKKIQLASTTGKISLSLRGDTDVGSAGRTAVTDRDLLPGTRHKNKDNIQGTVTIGGARFLLIEGKMVPASARRNSDDS